MVLCTTYDTTTRSLGVLAGRAGSNDTAASCGFFLSSPRISSSASACRSLGIRGASPTSRPRPEGAQRPCMVDGLLGRHAARLGCLAPRGPSSAAERRGHSIMLKIC